MANEPLTPAETARALGWLKEKGAERPCEACGHTQWVLGPHLLRMEVFQPGGDILIGGGTTYPMAFATCTNCMNVRMFMALGMGVEPPKKPQAPKEQAAEAKKPANG